MTYPENNVGQLMSIPVGPDQIENTIFNRGAVMASDWSSIRSMSRASLSLTGSLRQIKFGNPVLRYEAADRSGCAVSVFASIDLKAFDATNEVKAYAIEIAASRLGLIKHDVEETLEKLEKSQVSEQHKRQLVGYLKRMSDHLKLLESDQSFYTSSAAYQSPDEYQAMSLKQVSSKQIVRENMRRLAKSVMEYLERQDLLVVIKSEGGENEQCLDGNQSAIWEVQGLCCNIDGCPDPYVVHIARCAIDKEARNTIGRSIANLP